MSLAGNISCKIFPKKMVSELASESKENLIYIKINPLVSDVH